MRGGPARYPVLGANVNEKQNCQHNGGDQSCAACAFAGRLRFFDVNGVAERHAQQRNREQATDDANDVKHHCNVGRFDRQQRQRRAGDCTDAPGEIGNAERGSPAVAISFRDPQVCAGSGESVAQAEKCAGAECEEIGPRIPECEADSHHGEAQGDRWLKAFFGNQRAGCQNANKRANKLRGEKHSGASVVEFPLGDEDRQDRPDKGDDDAVDDEAAAQKYEDQILRGVSLGGDSLRFGGHHGILQEPEIECKCVMLSA